jgi:hypothetical protein
MGRRVTLSGPIHLKLVRFQENPCEHIHILINESLWQVECEDCGAILDPIAYLAKLAKKQELLAYQLENIEIAVNKAKGKLRTRCIHCGQFTPIRTGPQ